MACPLFSCIHLLCHLIIPLSYLFAELISSLNFEVRTCIALVLLLIKESIVPLRM